MPKITIRFDKKSDNDDDKKFIRDFFCSFGLDHKKAFYEQEFEIDAKSRVRLFGMDGSIPSDLVDESTWLCRVIREGGCVMFAVGDFIWAASLEKPESAQQDFERLSARASLRILKIENGLFITDLTLLSELENLKSLDLSFCDSLVDISPLSGLSSLTSLSLTNCQSLIDISAISGLRSLTNLNLVDNNPLVEIPVLSGLSSLTSLNLSWCKSLVDISALSGLSSLDSLGIGACQYLVDVSALSGLSSLTSLILYRCPSLLDISGLSGLSKLVKLDLRHCDSLFDISVLSGLGSLTVLDLYGSDFISDFSPLHGLTSLRSLSFTSRRIHTIEPLREIRTLREVKEFNPPEVAEVLAHTACLRVDRDFIDENKKVWLTEAKNWRSGAQSLQDRFATTLGEAFSLLGDHSIAGDYEAFLNDRPDFSSAPWKAWFGGTLKETGFVLYRQRVERVAVSQMLPGAIGGACTTLPYKEQPEWSRQWLMSLEKARLSDAKNLLAVAPEICLAHVRLNLNESLRRWLEAFTDPSDPGALDPIHAALAGFQLALGNLDAAESHVFAIESPSLRDPVLADLIASNSAIDSDRASAQLLLIEAPAIRRELAKTLAVLPRFSKSEIALHRLVVAMDDSSVALGEIISSLSASSPSSQLIQKISESLQVDRKETLRKIAEELHQQADQILADN